MNNNNNNNNNNNPFSPTAFILTFLGVIYIFNEVEGKLIYDVIFAV